MAASEYLTLFLDAGITHDQETYGRCIDAVLAQEGIASSDIIGLGEQGVGSIGRKSLYVVYRQGITLTRERGVFNRRIDVQRLCLIASIDRLRKTTEGFKPPELTITATSTDGAEVAKIVWIEPFEDWEKRLALRQREHLFEVIGTAMNTAMSTPMSTATATPSRHSVSAASSKASALRQWAARVVQASGVEVNRERVEEHANMAAGGIQFLVFLRLGAPLGISDLGQFYYPDPMPETTPLEGFDDLYSRVIARVGDAEVVDQAIDRTLADARDEFVRGCRERYSRR